MMEWVDDAAQLSYLSLERPRRTDDQCSWRAKTYETRCIEARGGGRSGIWRSGGSITTTTQRFYNLEARKASET